MEGYNLHLNSFGRGKGLAVYYKDNIVAIRQTENDVHQQISIMESRESCVIGLYRSAADTTLPNTLRTISVWQNIRNTKYSKFSEQWDSDLSPPRQHTLKAATSTRPGWEKGTWAAPSSYTVPTIPARTMMLFSYLFSIGEQSKVNIQCIV